MITKINIDNFKSIKHIEIDTERLNLFMGLNGMGKSTVIQSLLLLRQSYKGSKFKELVLNGELAEIGRGRDAMYNFAEKEEIRFDMQFWKNKKSNSLELIYSYDPLSDVLKLTKKSSEGYVSNEALFNDKFIFLSADRMAPSTAYDLSYDKVANQHALGNRGELAAHFLSMYGKKITVRKEMCLEGSDNLEDQVNAWMRIISPGIRVETAELPTIDKVSLSYVFGTESIFTSNLRPTNVGFGISYVLPILIACLSGMYQLIVIENPEAHLHPKGQAKMGELLARCCQAGAQIFVETHSDHIVNGLRVAVKENILPGDRSYINYFTKHVSKGESYTENTPIKIGFNGELSEYPEDFIDEWENQLLKLI